MLRLEAAPFRTMLRRHLQARRPAKPTGRRVQSTDSAAARTDTNNARPPKEDPIPVPNTVADVPIWQRLGPLTRLAGAYGRSQRKRPYVTQLCSSLAIFLCGDISAQRMSGKEYDPARTGRALLIGSTSSIPSYEWFLFLSRNFNYSSRVLSLTIKVVVNQVVFAPLFNTYFFGMQSLLAGDSVDQVIERIKRTVPTSVINSCKVWPAVTAVNFAFVPLEYRSVFAGVVAVGWQTYLSYLNRLAEEAAANNMVATLARRQPHGVGS